MPIAALAAVLRQHAKARIEDLNCEMYVVRAGWNFMRAQVFWYCQFTNIAI